MPPSNTRSNRQYVTHQYQFSSASANDFTVDSAKHSSTKAKYQEIMLEMGTEVRLSHVHLPIFSFNSILFAIIRYHRWKHYENFMKKEFKCKNRVHSTCVNYSVNLWSSSKSRFHSFIYILVKDHLQILICKLEAPNEKEILIQLGGLKQVNRTIMIIVIVSILSRLHVLWMAHLRMILPYFSI